MEDTVVRVHPDGTLIVATPEGWLETDLEREQISRPNQQRIDEAVEVDPIHLGDVWVDWGAQDAGDVDDYTYDVEDVDDPDVDERIVELLGRERLALGAVAGQFWYPYTGDSLPLRRWQRQAEEELRSLLRAIAAIDPSAPGAGKGHEYRRYSIRNKLILQAVGVAIAAGIIAGIDADPNQPDYPVVVYLRLPTGQVSWHLPPWWGEWDGHDTQEKYLRVREYLGGAPV
ncbi:MAG TPA: hypothetical protein VKZ67_09505 [Natronosporangium sp.]|nr:hypothetical protein [Natronosporangium sp.]